jgi:glyoxylase-like metal-dependent hydrolase (beta-lactamase superfamily II)
VARFCVDPIADCVWRCGSGQINWYLVVDDDRVMLVDAGLPGYRWQLAPALTAVGRRPSDIVAVALTHGHPDHVGFADAVRVATGATVYVHECDQQLVRTQEVPRGERSLARYCLRPRAWRTFAHIGRNGRPRPVPEVMTFRDGERLELPGRPRVVHLPGHTDGSCAFFFTSHGALLVGDALCEENPFNWRRGPQLMPAGFSVSMRRARSSLARIAELDAEVVGFGHGEPWRGSPRAAVEHAYRLGFS